MSDQKFIVLLIHQNGKAVPVLDETEYRMREFDSHVAAGDYARDTAFGRNFGYVALRWDGGVTEVL